jgi:hypothetical protein
VKSELIGELIVEIKGKTTGIRVLAEGKVEASHSGAGTLFGKDATVMDTAVSTFMPNGVMMVDVNGMLISAEGDPVMTKINGIGSTGKGLKSSLRGACYFMTNSPKLANLNKTVGVWELESEENGEYGLKVWAWK